MLYFQIHTNADCSETSTRLSTDEPCKDEKGRPMQLVAAFRAETWFEALQLRNDIIGFDQHNPFLPQR